MPGEIRFGIMNSTVCSGMVVLDRITTNREACSGLWVVPRNQYPCFKKQEPSGITG